MGPDLPIVSRRITCHFVVRPLPHIDRFVWEHLCAPSLPLVALKITLKNGSVLVLGLAKPGTSAARRCTGNLQWSTCMFSRKSR